MMMKKSTIFLHTGSNLGDAKKNLETANEYLKNSVGELVAMSSFYETAAWGVEDQPNFINQALELRTSHSPQRVLELILGIETQMGRIRRSKWGQRLIDIDLLFYNNAIIDSENLKVPHPFLQERNFVLVPLHEIAPDWVHPQFGLTITALLGLSTDPLPVTRIY